MPDHGYPPSNKASTPINWYHIILLDNNLPKKRYTLALVGSKMN